MKFYAHSNSGNAVMTQHVIDLWSGHCIEYITCPWGSSTALKPLLGFPTMLFIISAVEQKDVYMKTSCFALR